MIKKLHYCWFSAEKPAVVTENILDWGRLNPDFEICESNKQNSHFDDYEFARHAFEEKRWGFLSDVVRLQKLYEEGGFYLDADVELIRPLRVLEPEGDFLIMGYMYDCALDGGVLYSPPGHPLIGNLLKEYHRIQPGCWPVQNSVFTDYFINNVPGFLLNGRRWKSDAHKVSLYQKEFFQQPAFRREHGLSIHHCSGSWKPERDGEPFVSRPTYSHKVKWLKRKIRTFFSLLRSEYREAYFNALIGKASTKSSLWCSTAVPQ
jgi:hypothetical protein